MKSIATATALAGAALLAISAPALAAPTPKPRAAVAEPWSEVKLPSLLPSAALKDIDAQSAGSVWAGGFQGYFCVTVATTCLIEGKGSPVVRQWNGSGWKEYPMLGLLGEHTVDTVAADGNEVWVLGDSFPPVQELARFNGTAFVHVAGPAGRDVELLRANPAGVWITAQNSDGSNLYRRTGTTWTQTPLPAGMVRVRDVQALSATDAWAVGDIYDSGTRVTTPTLVHWDGTAWQAVPSPTQGLAGRARFTHVTPVAADDVWVTSGETLAHWNGNAWRLVPKPEGEQGRELTETVVDEDGVLWVTSCVSPWGHCRLYRYTTNGWERSEVEFNADFRLSVVPGTNTIVASGNQGEDPGVTAVPNDPSVLILRR